MIDIENKIESIRNMKNDLQLIKLTSQKNADKMFQHLADFRNRISHEMSKIENNYRSGRDRNQNQSSKLDQRQQQCKRVMSSDSDYNESQDSKQMSDILLEWQNYSKISTDASTSLSNSNKVSQENDKRNLSSDTLESTSTPGEVNLLFSKHLPYSTPDTLPAIKQEKRVSSDPPDPVRHQLNNNRFQNESNTITKDKVDKLTKKLKEIQTQNEELQNVNENIKNLLIKLSDLKYVDDEDAETVDKLDAIKRDSQMSNVNYHIPEINSKTILKTENYEKCIRSVEITNKTRSNMLTKINVAKLIIKRLRSCGNIADQEHKYKVRVRQAEQSITLKAHHKKPQ